MDGLMLLGLCTIVVVIVVIAVFIALILCCTFKIVFSCSAIQPEVCYKLCV